MTISRVTIVGAEPAELGMRVARDHTGESADWPAIVLTLRSPNRSETVVAGLRTVDDGTRSAPAGPDRGDDHLVADFHTAGIGWLRVADVIVREDDGSAQDSHGWLSDVFGRHPGCAVGAAMEPSGSLLVGLRDGRLIRLTPDGARSRPEIMASASFVHFWMANGQEIALLDKADLVLVTRDSPTCCRLTIEVLPPLRLQGCPDEPGSVRLAAHRPR